ncbi:acyl-CoA dehydrogenase family protein [Phytohabitans sp. ZYX-F-186]|uniref:Acyl-CoA dehydrogenase family protein n=1 Tax=Phytohabitans maris TaxID=3071409 RepID=A0ABU0ZKC1_9ACTN|nr:acyl-CoA dehydrogenase family protein [Phytohabitans sp. ZYX-F-186]MDQ7907489.1 acyl-CoA dehydrogenase family protein [Phytohabitans sp. ZYX-F-186]
MDFDLDTEQVAFTRLVRSWVDDNYPKERCRAIEAADGVFPVDLWNDMAKAGFHGIGIDPEYGGEGGDVVTQSILARELTRNLGGLSGVWGVSSFAGGKTLSTYGTAEQKAEYLPRLARGEIRFSIAITEPSGGTDLLGAMRSRIDKVPGGWRLNGQKVWSSGANTSDYLVVLAKDHEVGRSRSALTAVLVPTTTPGLDIRRIPKLGMRSFAACEVFFDDVVVPDEMLIGVRGRGWHQLLPTLNNERIITASSALGVLDAVLEDALQYVKERQAFGKPIGQFQALQHYVADMVAWREQAELLVRRAAWLQSLDRPCGVEATLAHYVSAEYANQAADRGIQLLGGLGYSMETDMQRYWRDSRLYRIAPITGEMARNMVAEAQGLPRSF